MALTPTTPIIPDSPSFPSQLVSRVSIRESILRAIVSRLNTITIENGYNLDIGDNVFRAKRSDDPRGVPMIVVWDSNESTTREFGNRVASLTVGIEVVIEYAENIGPSESVNLAIADILVCMFSQDSVLSGLVDDIIEINNNGIFPDDGRLVSGMQVGFQIKYTTVVGDPYTLVI